MMSGVIYNVGDCVFVQNEDACNPYDIEECDIARILKCFDSGDKKDNRRVIVKWYSRMKIAKERLRRNLPEEIPPIITDLEVLREERAFETEVDIESIHSKCCVEEVVWSVDPSTVMRSPLAIGPLFVCRFSYGGRVPILKPFKCEADLYCFDKKPQKTSVRRSLATNLTDLTSNTSSPKHSAKKKPAISKNKENDIMLLKENMQETNSPRKRQALGDINTSQSLKRQLSSSKDCNDEASKRIKLSTPSEKENSGAMSSPHERNPLGDDLVDKVTNSGRKLMIICKKLFDTVDLDKIKGLGDSTTKEFTPKKLFKNDTPKKKHVKESSLSKTPMKEGSDSSSRSRSSRGDLEISKSKKAQQNNFQEEEEDREDEDVTPLRKSPKEKLDHIKKIGKVRALKVNEITDLLGDDSDDEGSLMDASDLDTQSDVEELPKKSGKVRSAQEKSKLEENSQKDTGKAPESKPKCQDKTASHKCLVCTAAFDSVEELDLHQDTHEDDVFSDKKARRGRPRVSSVQKSGRRVKTYSCQDCGEEFDSKMARDDHELEHDEITDKKARRGRPRVSSVQKSGRRVKTYTCQDCGEEFDSKMERDDHELEHDDEITAMETPRRKSKKTSTTTPKRTPKSAKKSETPKSSKKRVAEPNMPARNHPVDFPQTPLEQARAKLHVSAVPDSLPCREDEFQQIYSFVEGKLYDGTGGCMYISGVPGTGKTATVKEVVKILQDSCQEGDIPPFTFLEVNAMRLTEPHQLWVQVWKGLTGSKVTAEHASSLLEKRFSVATPRREPTLLLVDELDLLWTRKQDVMYNLFDWPSRPGSKLIVVAIANTMDLPERIMINRVSSRLGLTRMTFQPYTYKQLQEIVLSRLLGIDAFDPDAVQLVARKVAAVSGDARRALDICRRSTEIAENERVSGTPMKSPFKRKALVGMMHVDSALKEMFTSPKIMAIRCCSTMEKFVLRGIVEEFTRTGLEEAVFGRVLQQYDSLCRFEGIEPLSCSAVMKIVNHLTSYRLILTEHSRNDLNLRLRLNISTDDINYALKNAL